MWEIIIIVGGISHHIYGGESNGSIKRLYGSY